MLSIPGDKKYTNQIILRFYLTPVRMAIYHQEHKQKQMLSRMQGGKITLIHCWWEYKLVKPLWKTVWSLLKKLKIELPYDSAIQCLDTCLK
jgi:hypothetical protein